MVEVLGVEPTAIDCTVQDMVYALVDLGIVRKAKKYKQVCVISVRMYVGMCYFRTKVVQVDVLLLLLFLRNDWMYKQFFQTGEFVSHIKILFITSLIRKKVIRYI